jgi:hypothetical protein
VRLRLLHVRQAWGCALLWLPDLAVLGAMKPRLRRMIQQGMRARHRNRLGEALRLWQQLDLTVAFAGQVLTAAG